MSLNDDLVQAGIGYVIDHDLGDEHVDQAQLHLPVPSERFTVFMPSDVDGVGQMTVPEGVTLVVLPTPRCVSVRYRSRMP